jgi:RNA methyltransferase, TrmH family
MEIIESLENNKVKEITKLQQKKYRDLENKYIVEGIHLIEEAYDASILSEIVALPDFTTNINCHITYVSKAVMKKISNLDNPPMAIGIVTKYPIKNYGKRLLLLDNIQDPGNLGTIIRSACAFNIDTIILSDTCVDLYNSKVIRATEGMMFHIDIMRTNLIALCDELLHNNYQVLGTNVINGLPLNKITFKDKFAIVIGSEGQGISEEVKNKINDNIYIPMNNKCESLNASVAASIIMYEMSKVDYE